LGLVETLLLLVEALLRHTHVTLVVVGLTVEAVVETTVEAHVTTEAGTAHAHAHTHVVVPLTLTLAEVVLLEVVLLDGDTVTLTGDVLSGLLTGLLVGDDLELDGLLLVQGLETLGLALDGGVVEEDILVLTVLVLDGDETETLLGGEEFDFTLVRHIELEKVGL